VQRKAYTPPAPKADAVIVHTARTMYSSRAMGLGRYEVGSKPMQRIGDADWSMSVGSAA